MNTIQENQANQETSLYFAFGTRVTTSTERGKAVGSFVRFSLERKRHFFFIKKNRGINEAREQQVKKKMRKFAKHRPFFPDRCFCCVKKRGTVY